MKSLALLSRGKLAVKETPVPRLRDGEILVEMKCCGVCGTDIEKVNGEAITPPVLGHEVVGVVAKVGMGVKGLQEGDRVFAHHHAPCYDCELCSRGEYTLCAEFPRHNIRPGGFAEFFAVPRWNVERGSVLKLPRRISFEEASFVEPAGCCIRALRKVGTSGLRSAVIHGAGPVGLTHLLLLLSYGCRKVVVSDLSEYRLAFAKRVGATAVYDPRSEIERQRAFEAFDGGSPELAVVATGSAVALEAAMMDVARGGRILLFGAPTRGSTLRLDLARYFLSGVTVVPSYSTSEVETKEALRLLTSGRLSLSRLVTHRFLLEDAPEAFMSAQKQMCVKAVVGR